MEIVKQFYQVTFLGETSELLTPEEFAQLQKECKEIYEYGKDEATLPPFEAYVYKSMQPPDVKEELTVPDPVIEAVPGNREKLLEKSAHKGIQAEVEQGMILQAEIDQMVAPIDKVRDQMDTEVLKDKVEAMEAPKKRGRPSKTAKDLKPLKKDAAVPPLDPEMDQIRKLAADKYGLAWTDAKRIWCLGSDLTKEQVAAVLPWVYPDTVWGFYRECHKWVEA